MRMQLARDGFVLVRGAVPADAVLAARECVADDLGQRGFVEPGAGAGGGFCDLPIPPTMQQPAADDAELARVCAVRTASSPGLLGRQAWIRSQPALVSLLEHGRLRLLATLLLAPKDGSGPDRSSFDGISLVDPMGGDASGDEMSCESGDESGDESVAQTLPFKWLRAVGTGLFTGLHCDRVYVGHIHPRMLTIWMPLGRVTTAQGSMVACAGSHMDETWRHLRETYGRTKVGNDGTQSGWISRDPAAAERMLLRPDGDAPGRSLPWMSADFEPGDVCVLTMDVMHMSATNTTSAWRISCDTRWLLLDSGDD
nr:hypothetical protein HK105_000363 [Polyrhizophydium stewartii]